MVYNNISIYYDLIYVLTEYFNNDIKIKLLDLKGVSEYIRPFFYKGNRKYSYMESILIESYDELLSNNNISVIQDKLIDCERTVKAVSKFYFSNANIDFSFNDYNTIYHLNREITKSGYPDEIKSSLYSLFIEPHKTINALMRTLFELHSQLMRIYENYMFSISKIQQEIDQMELLKNLNIPNSTSEDIIYSICLFDNECVKNIEIKNNKTLLILGIDYHKTFELSNQFDLKEFGYVLTEINRLKLINMMHINGEITIKQIEQELYFSGTNAYYHLSLMTKVGMVTTRYEGRTVFYSLNKSYFRTLCSKLSKYYE